MEKVEINLQFKDKGYGITGFYQTITLEEPLQVEARGFAEDESEHVNALAAHAWEWIRHNENEIKDFLAQKLADEFDEMRGEGKKHVPDEDYDVIRVKLTPLQMRWLTFYNHGAFEISYRAPFNELEYGIWVSVNAGDLTFKNAGILTMGGFKPPKQQKKPSFKTAAALYARHKEYGNAKDLYKHYAALSSKEIDSYIDLFIADGEDIDDRIDCLLYLALFSHTCGKTLPDKLYRFLIDNEVFYYGEIYLRTDEKFADELIDALGTVDNEETYRLSINHILCALAAMPYKRTNDFFIESSHHPLPIWARKLHILPKDYAKAGGWETTDGGFPRLLFDNAVTSFEKCAKEKTSELVPVKILGEVCGICGEPLTLVFAGEQKLATCMHCSCYQTIYMKIEDNMVRWHKSNILGDFFTKHPKYIKDAHGAAGRMAYGLRPSKEKRLAMWTANQFVEISLTQIGGMPTAVNDIEYPQCLDCGKTMRFAAQLAMDDFDDEGIYYFYTCDICGVTAANYDQS